MPWTPPAHVSSGPASSAAFNEEVVDNLTWLNPDGGWQDYSPSNVNLNHGTGTLKGRYYQSGPLCFFAFHCALGAGAAITGAVSIGLPLPVSLAAPDVVILHARLRDVSSASGFYSATASAAPGGSVAGLTYNAGANVNATAPFTWASGDLITVTGFYPIDPD